MKTVPVPRIVEAERLADGVIITFDDGKHAVYSASLLYDTLPQTASADDFEADSMEGSQDSSE